MEGRARADRAAARLNPEKAGRRGRAEDVGRCHARQRPLYEGGGRNESEHSLPGSLPTFRVGLASAAEAEAPTSETVACADGDCDIDGDDVSEVDTDGEPDADAEVHSDALIVELGVARPVAVSLPGAIVAVTEADDGGETECEGELDTV